MSKQKENTREKVLRDRHLKTLRLKGGLPSAARALQRNHGDCPTVDAEKVEKARKALENEQLGLAGDLMRDAISGSSNTVFRIEAWALCDAISAFRDATRSRSPQLNEQDQEQALKRAQEFLQQARRSTDDSQFSFFQKEHRHARAQLWLRSAARDQRNVTIEVAGCISFCDEDGDEHIEAAHCSGGKPEFWTVYVRTPFGEVLAIEDYSSARRALRSARQLRAEAGGNPKIVCITPHGDAKPLKRLDAPTKSFAIQPMPSLHEA